MSLKDWLIKRLEKEVEPSAGDIDLHDNTKNRTIKIVKSKYNKCKICNNSKKEDINIICDYCAWITGRCPECGGLIK